MRYERFRLQIVTGSAGERTVHAFSPRGEGQAPFVLPCGFGPEALGERLFEALFPGEILRLYERSLDLLEGDPEAGLRIELMLDPRIAGAAALQQLPWELMRQPGTPEFLALSRRRPFVRYLTVPRAVYAPRRVEGLRILVVAPNPRASYLEPLDLARELRNLEQAIAPTAALELVRPEAPTFAALRRACLERECQVLHFMGHGGSVPDGAEGVLFFETEAGRADPVRGVDLVNKLVDFPTLRLVVLNACSSAASPDPTRADPLGSVAGSLVLGGMPAVVAMQRALSDPAAIAFSRAFYQRLAAGDSAEVAVAEGRQAVHSADPEGIEWATPVLFLRGQEAPAQGRPARRFTAFLLGLMLVAVLVIAGWSWWRGQLLTQGVAHFEQGQWSEARERFRAALRLAPGSAEILSNLAATEERLGDSRAAEDHYREAVSQRPDSPEHLFNLGHFLNGRERYGEAYPILQQAAVNEPGRVDAHGELAHAALALGMLDKARVALSTGLLLDPEHPALHRLLGELELKAGNPRAALSHLNEARRRYALGEIGRVETTWLLVQAYELLGNAGSVCREMQEYRRLDELGIAPWAPAAAAVAARFRCPS